MSIEIIKEINIAGDVKSNLDKLAPVFERAIKDAIAVMKTDIEKGRDVNGQTFTPYTKRYAEWREKKKYRVEPPNLRVTGNMLQAVQSRVEKKGAQLVGIVDFNSAREALKAEGNLKKRDFFGFSKESLDRIKRKLEEALGK
jgi:hypothetical protein